MSHLEEGLLHALLDGEIPSAELPPIQAHLEVCESCRARLEEERRLLTDADGLVGMLEVPRAKGSPVLRAAPLRRRRSWTRGLAWAASVLAALGLGYAARGVRVAPATRAAAIPAQAESIPAAPAPAELAGGTGATSAGSNSAPVAPRAQILARQGPRRESAAAGAGAAVDAAKATAQDAAESRAAIGLQSTSRPDSTKPLRDVQSAPPATPAAAVPAAAGRTANAPLRVDNMKANVSLLASPSGEQLAPPEPISLPDAVRRLGGSLQLIQGLVPLRLEAQGPYVRVVYQVTQGELVLSQQLIDGRVVSRLIAPPEFPNDSLARLRARVRE